MGANDERRAALARGIADFIAAVEAQPDDLFVRAIDGRTPRDIVAHLIGWNWHALETDAAVRRGELPGWTLDPGPDFVNVNAESLRRYASRNKAELLGQLRASAADYDRMLGDLAPAEWDDNHDVTWRGRAVSTGWLAEALIHDYSHHRQEIEGWAAQEAGA